MQRETTTVELKGGKKLVVQSYLTGRENNDIKRATYAGIGMTQDKIIDKIPLTSTLERNQKVIQFAVVSINGVVENAYEKVLDLPSQEYDELVAKLEELYKLNFTPAK